MSTALLAYQCRSNFEHKAARELRDQGVNVILPDDTTGKRRKITAPSYVFADRAADITFAKHVRPALPGTATLDAVMRMFRRPDTVRAVDRTIAFVVGEQVAIEGRYTVEKGQTIPVSAVVVDVRKQTCIIEFDMAGKAHRQAVHQRMLRKIHDDS